VARIPDAISVASLDTHCLIVAVPNDGPAEVSSSLPRPVAAGILRQLADGLERQQCPTALATGQPCPIHDATDNAPRRPAGLDDLLDHVAGHLDDDQLAAEQPAPPNLADAFAAFGAKMRAALEQTAANLAAFAEAQQRPAEQAVEEQPATDDDPRPVIEVDLEQPATEQAVEDTLADGTVRCAHEYGLMRDSCPGCDHEQETPHEADPVTVRPSWAKRNMRRCRRCALVPSHPIHKAKRAEQ